MIKIDNSLLQDIRLGSLPDHEKDSLLKHIYETLEMRVGMRLADQMSNQQLDEFEQYFEAKDDAGAFKWLETNFPNYKDVVQEEFDKLKAEVQSAAPQILAAATPHQSAAQPLPTPDDPLAAPQSPQTPTPQAADWQQSPPPAPQPPASQPPHSSFGDPGNGTPGMPPTQPPFQPPAEPRQPPHPPAGAGY